jgi:hypothetical protein
MDKQFDRTSYRNMAASLVNKGCIELSRGSCGSWRGLCEKYDFQTVFKDPRKRLVEGEAINRALRGWSKARRG